MKILRNQMKKAFTFLMMCLLLCASMQPALVEAKVVELDPVKALQETYAKNSIAEAKFKSGGIDHTHQYIVTQALSILENDLGTSLLNDQTYASSLCTYTDWPDKVGNETDYVTYSGHFYNPYTGKNWLGRKSPTALSRSTSYFDKAVTAYQSGDVGQAIEYLGKGSHYVSDLNEPHHASNLTAVNSNHSEFESYVDENRMYFYIEGNSLYVSYYVEAQTTDISKILINGAYYTYDLQYMAQDENTYFEAGQLCVQHAIINMVQYLYAFGLEAGIYE